MSDDHLEVEEGKMKEMEESKTLNPKRTLNIYIRHADKLYHNSKFKTLGFDPDLKEGEKGSCYALAKNLIEVYGMPNVIRTSPFLRARRTADHFQSYILRKTQKRSYVKDSIKIPKIEVRVELTEYLGNQKGITSDNLRYLVTPDTFTHEVLIEKGKDDLTTRVHHILNMQQIPDLEDEKVIIWNISHGVVINHLRKHLYPDLYKSERLGFLEFGLLLSEGDQVLWLDSDTPFTWDSITQENL